MKFECSFKEPRIRVHFQHLDDIGGAQISVSLPHNYYCERGLIGGGHLIIYVYRVETQEEVGEIICRGETLQEEEFLNLVCHQMRDSGTEYFLLINNKFVFTLNGKQEWFWNYKNDSK